MIFPLLLILFMGFAAAENGLAAWLRYAPLKQPGSYVSRLPLSIVALNATVGSPVHQPD